MVVYYFSLVHLHFWKAVESILVWNPDFASTLQMAWHSIASQMISPFFVHVGPKSPLCWSPCVHLLARPHSKKASNIVHWWAALFFLGRQARMCAFILCISKGSSVWSTFKHSGSDGIHTIARYLVRPSFKSPQNPAWNATPFLQRNELHCDLSLFQCMHPIASQKDFGGFLVKSNRWSCLS